MNAAGLCMYGASAGAALHVATPCRATFSERPCALPSVLGRDQGAAAGASAPSAPSRHVALAAAPVPSLAVGLHRRKAGRPPICRAAVGGETTADDYDRELEGDDPGVTAIVKVEDTNEGGAEGGFGAGGPEDGGEGDLGELKQQLIDTLYGTERGLRASSETRGEVLELIAKLEAKNPNAAPTAIESRHLLNGKWVLAYTSYSEVYPLLAAGTLPLVRVGEISQTIDTTFSRFTNAITFEGPVASTTFSATASFEVRSPSRLQITFEEAVLSPPAVAGSPQTPDALYLFGQRLPLDPVRPLLDALQAAALQVAKLLSGQPPLRLRVGGTGPGGGASSWLLTTFLDEDLRVARGDGGGIFLLTKAGSALGSSYY